MFEGATTSCPVTKSIHHLLKASPITHISFVTKADSWNCLPRETSVWKMQRPETCNSVVKAHSAFLPEHELRPVLRSSFVSSSHTRPDCVCRLFCETSVCCSALCLLLLGELLKCCSERASKTQCTDVVKTQNKSQHTHRDTHRLLQYEAFFWVTISLSDLTSFPISEKRLKFSQWLAEWIYDYAASPADNSYFSNCFKHLGKTI